MSRMAEMAVYEGERDNLSGIDDCEYDEFVKSMSEVFKDDPDLKPDVFKDMGIHDDALDKLNKLGEQK